MIEFPHLEQFGLNSYYKASAAWEHLFYYHCLASLLSSAEATIFWKANFLPPGKQNCFTCPYQTKTRTPREYRVTDFANILSNIIILMTYNSLHIHNFH